MDYVKWLGHAAFELSLDSKRILVDPWLTGNPLACCSPRDLEKADIILVTHDHGDHLGDAIEIAKRFDSTLVAIYEIAVHAQQKGVKRTIGTNIGGYVEVEGLKIVVTPALHSSERGVPVGFIVIGSKHSIYHAGDTGFFSDIKYYAEVYPIEVALVPIGGTFTMDPILAAKFVSIFKPKIVVPMHYNTFPPIRQNPEEFKKAVEKYSPETKVIILKPGEKFELT